MEFSYVEQSTPLQPGIDSITSAHTHSLGIALFSKYFKNKEKEYELSLNIF